MTLEEIIAERDQLEYNTQESADWLISRVKQLEAALADTINGQGKRILEFEDALNSIMADYRRIGTWGFSGESLEKVRKVLE